ncbi:hypothetical protein HJG60_008257 [Phyllostomus discolor]|uniref:Uncharacterized protein n=1 Tax=Phyllostomus discolor TaxID=89673 RepID=A0A834DSK9_9CHIR|nr:hypothetical protein HJG60_008257 [Phyllostomus discolor]
MGTGTPQPRDAHRGCKYSRMCSHTLTHRAGCTPTLRCTHSLCTHAWISTITCTHPHCALRKYMEVGLFAQKHALIYQMLENKCTPLGTHIAARYTQTQQVLHTHQRCMDIHSIVCSHRHPTYISREDLATQLHSA